MERTGIAGRAVTTAVTVLLGAILTMSTTACSRPEPDVQEVADAVGRLPGVTSVNASFANWDLLSGGDQKIEVEVSARPDPTQVEDLVRSLPRAVREVEHGDRYSEFVIATEPADEGSATTSSSLTYGRELAPPGLATRWVAALATTPGGELRVRAWASPRQSTASFSSHSPVSTSLEWALGTDLADLGWSLVDTRTTGTPHTRFTPDRPLAADMVESWKAIEATWAHGIGAASIARSVVVEDLNGIRRARVTLAFPTETGPLAEATHGPLVWPIVTAIHEAMPTGHRLDLDLRRQERSIEGGGAGNEDLVGGGTGSPDWEAAYRQRFPEAVTPSPTPT